MTGDERVTWSDYPRTIYPGFTDPQDYRELVGVGGTDRDHFRSRQLVDGADRDHVQKHDRHDHPWCPECCDRMESFARLVDGTRALPRPAQLQQIREDATSERMTVEAIGRLKRFMEEPWAPEPGDGAKFGLSDAALEAWFDFYEGLDAFEEARGEGRNVATRRALRYLIVHGRVPKDDYDPDNESDFEEEYLDLDELSELEQPASLISSVLPRNSYGILGGRDQSFKSFVALDWSLRIATGTAWQGHTCDPATVLYIAGEGAYGIEKRVAAWMEATYLDVDPDRFIVRKSALNLHQPGPAFDHLLEVIRERRVEFVVVDTLRRVSGGADGNSTDMGAVVDNLDAIRRATNDGTVLVIAHSDKGDSDTRGFSGIEDDADFVWHAKRDENQLRLVHRKMKDGPEHADVLLETSIVGPSLVLISSSPAVATATDSQLRVLDALRYATDEGGSGPALMKASGLPKSTFYVAVQALREAGHIVNTGTKTRPFYELPDQDHESSESSAVQEPIHAQSPASPSDSTSSAESPVQSSPPYRAGLGLRTGLEQPEAVIR